jgi:integrase/recombinase XerD
MPNSTNSTIIKDFYEYMKANSTSENYQNQNLKAMIVFANFLGPDTSFFDIKSKQQIIAFLDTRTRSADIDPDKRWITTWNDYLWRIKYFLRWLHNHKEKELKGTEPLQQSEWITPLCANIKKKKTKRISPYLESELWERDEILSIIKYERHKRNKAALALLWDLNARPHEVSLLKIKHIRLKEKYGEGEVPHEAKTGTGPILLTCSFPYVRDWLNEHPFRNESNARLICNLLTGGPIKSDALWTIMKQLQQRILRLLEEGSVADYKERQKLELLLKAKKWNPYCLRHSAITSDSDYLPEYALKKKVRWSMNSKQGSRYIKRRMGNDLKEQILAHNGVISESQKQKRSSVLLCGRCELINAVDNKYCSKCSYPLVPSAFDEIKAAENERIHAIQVKYEQDIKSMREEMENKFQQILTKIEVARLK